MYPRTHRSAPGNPLAIGLALALGLAACGEAPTSPPAAPPAPPVARVQAEVSPLVTATCPSGTESASGAMPGSGALYLICIPPAAAWNGSVVVYAHGYVNPFDPLAIQDDAVGGIPVSRIVTGLGFAFATTSYRDNGLIIVEGVRDLKQLVDKFRQVSGGGHIPGLTLAVGASEGALVAVLATERYPRLFDGTLALCGPLGDFAQQLDYFDDFRLLFDWFFPGVIPGSIVAVPDAVVQAWLLPIGAPGSLQAAVLGALAADPAATAQLLAAAGLDVPPDPAVVGETVLRLLAYNVVGTGNAVLELGGQPYDNIGRVYPPPVDNTLVPRFSVDQNVRSHLRAKYETDGSLTVPVVTMHNLFDPVVPYWHEALYAARVQQAGASAFLTRIPGATLASPFGHCTFTLAEVGSAFALLLSQVGAP